jgi:hypothetical protein
MIKYEKLICEVNCYYDCSRNCPLKEDEAKANQEHP